MSARAGKNRAGSNTTATPMRQARYGRAEHTGRPPIATSHNARLSAELLRQSLAAPDRSHCSWLMRGAGLNH